MGCCLSRPKEIDKKKQDQNYREYSTETSYSKNRKKDKYSAEDVIDTESVNHLLREKDKYHSEKGNTLVISDKNQLTEEGKQL